MKNINREVWRYIDNNIAVKKNLFDGLINVRALAKKIIHDLQLRCSVNAVISAIRRYEGKVDDNVKITEVYKLLQKAKLSTKTKLCSVLFRKNQNIRKKLGDLFSEIDFEGGDVLRIFEVTKYIKIIIDEKTLDTVRKIFSKTELVNIEKNIGEINIGYNTDITKTPGVFATMANELAINNISVVDSMICHSEHIIIVKEKDIKKAFGVVYNIIVGRQ